MRRLTPNRSATSAGVENRPAPSLRFASPTVLPPLLHTNVHTFSDLPQMRARFCDFGQAQGRRGVPSRLRRLRHAPARPSFPECSERGSALGVCSAPDLGRTLNAPAGRLLRPVAPGGALISAGQAEGNRIRHVTQSVRLSE